MSTYSGVGPARSRTVMNHSDSENTDAEDISCRFFNLIQVNGSPPSSPSPIKTIVQKYNAREGNERREIRSKNIVFRRGRRTSENIPTHKNTPHNTISWKKKIYRKYQIFVNKNAVAKNRFLFYDKTLTTSNQILY